MTQLGIWECETSEEKRRVVNVAQVPQRSPFRYPGGKTWLVPHIRMWLRSLQEKPKTFVEPFIGGGIVSLTVAFEDLADQIVAVELDRDVASVWQTMLSDNNDWLANRIIEFDLTPESVKEELAKPAHDTKHRAFQTILRNRIYHGGILAPGSGVLKHGENGKGLRSHWYPQTLFKRIQNIKHVRNKITFIQGDGKRVLKDYAQMKTAVFFIDPPYTAGKNGKRAGTRLYTHNELDHEELFKQSEDIKGDLLMTYDNAEEVMQLATRHGFIVRQISMTNTHHATMQELVIGHDLTWLPS